MAHNLQDTIALLARTPEALDALLRGLPEAWTHHNEGEGTFTVVDVVGHLIYADKVDWMSRTRMILEYGETRPFEPFDRWGHVRECEGRTLPQLLDEFTRVRAGMSRGLALAQTDAVTAGAARTPSVAGAGYAFGVAGCMGRA